MEIESLNWSHIEPTKRKIMTAFDSDFENIPDPEALFSNLPKDQLDPANAVAIRILLWGLGCVNRLNFGGKSTASLSKRSVFLDKLSAVVEQKWPAVSATKAQVNARKISITNLTGKLVTSHEWKKTGPNQEYQFDK